MDRPRVTAVMPVYNCQDIVVRAGLCILKQSYTNLNLHILDDGSTDDTYTEAMKLVKYYDSIDWKPKYLTTISKHCPNRGIVDTLNDGLLSAMREPRSAVFIARMDADDTCSLSRIEKQVEYMTKNNLDLCGTWAHIVDENGSPIEDFHPHIPENEERKWLTKFNYFIHGSVMVRTDILKKVGVYSDARHMVEDFDLWTRIADAGRIGILEDYLYTLVRRQDSITAAHGNEIYNKAKEIREYWAKKWNITIPDHDLPDYNTRRTNG